MAHCVQNLSEAEKRILNRQDFRPFLHPEFMGFKPGDEKVRKACLDTYFLDTGALGKPSNPSSLIRSQDVRDFYDIWAREHPGNSTGPDPLCGHWVIGGWKDTGQDAIAIIQYKTFRICVRAGPTGIKIIISTSDIREFLARYLDGVANERASHCLSYLICYYDEFQLVIVPVPESVLRHSIWRFETTVFAQDEPYDVRKWQIHPAYQLVPASAETVDNIRRYIRREKWMYHYFMSWFETKRRFRLAEKTMEQRQKDALDMETMQASVGAGTMNGKLKIKKQDLKTD